LTDRQLYRRIIPYWRRWRWVSCRCSSSSTSCSTPTQVGFADLAELFSTSSLNNILLIENVQF